MTRLIDLLLYLTPRRCWARRVIRIHQVALDPDGRLVCALQFDGVRPAAWPCPERLAADITLLGLDKTEAQP